MAAGQPAVQPPSREAGGSHGALEATRRHLSERLETVREQISRHIERQSRQETAPAGEVQDPGDESVALEETDLEHALIERDLAEARQIESALARLEAGTYGYCIDCGAQIEAARLKVFPAAERCIPDQTRYEKRLAVTGLDTPSL